AAFSIPFIGVVPAVKPAAGMTRNGRIGVLATPQTVRNDYLTGLINDFAAGLVVTRIAAPALRDLVEERFFSASPEEKRSVIADAAAAVRDAGVDTVVLACTHFLHVDTELGDVLGKNVLIIDSREGVINQLGRVLEKEKLSAHVKPGPNLFYVTGADPVQDRYRSFATAFGLGVGGTLS
ncbi:MAG TPA: glutamate racemase, partial [Spirochaetia bacterium]|nr:glutamate racemase [Spirochaetia bacterium]